MSPCHRLTVVSAALLASVSVGASTSHAQSNTTKSDLETSAELREVFERIERQDKQAAEERLLIDKSKNARSRDTELSFGSVEDGSDRPYSLDPRVDPDPMPGFGLNLKVDF